MTQSENLLDIESQLLVIWEELFGRPVTTTDDFFELGGDSLLATQLTIRITAVLGIDIRMPAIFQWPTIAELAPRLPRPRVPNSRLSLICQNGCTAPASLPGQQLTGDLPGASGYLPEASYEQERLWFLDRLHSGVPNYNIVSAWRVAGPLQVPLLQKSLSLIVERHESLRTTFLFDDEKVKQVIHPPAAVVCSVTNLENAADPTRKQEDYLLAEREYAFNLESGPLFRVRLLRHSETEHVLITNQHHIIYDAHSKHLFFKELADAYTAFSQGCVPELTELCIPFSEHARRQRTRLHPSKLTEELSFWQRQLEELTALDLPSDRVSQSEALLHGETVSCDLDSDATETIKLFSVKHNVTPYMSVLTAFKALLIRYTGQMDIAIAAPITTRTSSELESLIGLFVNTVILRTRFDDDPSFADVLREVRRTTLAAYAHREVPLQSVVQTIGTSNTPNLNVGFNFVNPPPRLLTAGPLTFHSIDLEDRTAKFDLLLTIRTYPDKFRICFTFDTRRFRRQTIERMAGHFRALISSMLPEPETKIWRAPLLSPGEYELMVNSWNNTDTAFPRKQSIPVVFQSQAAAHPDAIAVQHGTEQISYHGLNQQANRLARAIQVMGGTSGSLVGVCLGRSLGLVISKLAVLKAGAAYVPVNVGYPAERRDLMLANCNLLITDRNKVGLFQHFRGRMLTIDDPALADFSDLDLPINATGDSPAALLYTSGSTGIPKGALIPHRAVTSLVVNTNYLQFCSDDVVALRANICFDVALFEIWGPLLNGAKIVILDQEIELSPKDFLLELSRSGITVLWITTSLFHLMADEASAAFAGLRAVFVGGEILDPAKVQKVMAAGKPGQLFNVYGPTETTAFSTTYEIRTSPATDAKIPLGRPIANTKVYIMDPHQNLVPIGVPGEIYIAGAGLALGYLGSEELTKSKFIKNSFSEASADRLYRTGDRGRFLPDGCIEFLGRADLQVKIRGFRIEPAEIEAVIKCHPSAKNALVTINTDKDGERRIIAYVERSLGTGGSTEAIREYLERKLPNYMTPSAIVFLERFPLNNNGKVDRHALPEPKFISSVGEPITAQDTLEGQLVAIWERVLKIKPIGVTDNFFLLGGHSLLAVRMFSEMEKVLGRKLPLATLLQDATIRHLASVLRDQGWKPNWSSLVPIRNGGSRLPFFGVHGGDGEVMFYRPLSEALGPDQPFFALQANGLDGGEILYRTIEAMARYYISEIKKVQPAGPYLLGGYSFGGIVAFEMAQQFRAAGEQIALLVLFDTQNPARTRRHYSRPERLARRLFALASRPDRLVSELVQGAPLSKPFQALRKPAPHWQPQVQSPEIPLDQTSEVPRHIQQLRICYQNALRDYRFKGYDGKLTLFRASDPDPKLHRLRDNGWSEFVTGTLDTYFLPGSHWTIMNPDNAVQLAKTLKLCIVKALTNPQDA